MSAEAQENIEVDESDSQSSHSSIQRSPDSSPACSDVSNPVVSPPTSPSLVSPPTSPECLSPATSDDCHLHSDDSSSASPPKRQRRDNSNVSLDANDSDNDQLEVDMHQHGGNEESSPEVSSCSSDSDNDEENRSGNSNSEVSSESVCCSDNSDENSSDDEGIESLYEGSELSSNEALYRVLKLYNEERWTKVSLDKTVKLIKKFLPDQNNFPGSGKAALKSLKELTVESYCEREYQICCECSKHVDGTDSCVHCGSKDVTKFYIFPPQVQLKHLFEQRGLADIIDSHRGQSDRRDGCISDILDGSMYKSVKSNLNGPYDVVLLWNTDGVSMSHSSKEELWPILGTICEVPPRLRPTFMLVFGIFMGKQKPDMNVFLKPFVACLKECFDDGVAWIHPRNKEVVNSKIVAPFLSADAPAKAMVLKVKRFNARYGCNTCEQKAKLIELTPEELQENAGQPNPRKRIKRKRRFLFEEDLEPAPLRTGPRMNAQGLLAEERRMSRKGVLGSAVVSEIPFFDRAESVCAEYLHLVLLGPVKYFLHKMFFEAGPWFIGDKKDEINMFISSIKVPDFVKRLPRGTDDFSYWKASEFRNFLLYYAAPLFKEFAKGRYYQHWLLLIGSTHILLKDSITENDLQSAEIMLRAFLRDVHHLYGPACYTYDVHNLVHLCLLVKRHGPLWATSAFSFEGFNGFIADRLHGTKHLGKELMYNINISQSIAILGNIVHAEHHSNRMQLVKTELLGKCHDKDVLSEEEVTALSDAGLSENLAVYLRAKHMLSIYTSRTYDEGKKRSNSYIEFKPLTHKAARYGQVIAFVKSENGPIYCLLQTFKVLHIQLLLHEDSTFVLRNLVPVEFSEDLLVIPVDNIVTKVLKIGIYLGKRPNSVEVNL